MINNFCKTPKVVLYLLVFLCVLFSGCDPLAKNLTYQVVTLDGMFYDSHDPEFALEARPEFKTKVDPISCIISLTSQGKLKVFNQKTAETFQYDLKMEIPSGQTCRIRANYHETENMLWICVEKWSASYRNGYVDDTLEESRLISVSLSDMKFQIDKGLGKNELFLITNDTKVYFYKKNNVYRKDLNDWKNKENVCKISTDDMSILNFDMSEAGKIYISGNLHSNRSANMPVPPKQVVIITLEEEPENSDSIP